MADSPLPIFPPPRLFSPAPPLPRLPSLPSLALQFSLRGGPRIRAPLTRSPQGLPGNRLQPPWSPVPFLALQEFCPRPAGQLLEEGAGPALGEQPREPAQRPPSGHTISSPRRLTLRRPPCSEPLSPLFGEGPLVPESLITGWRFLKSRPQGLAVSAAASSVFCSGAPRQPCQAAALPTSPGPLPGAARRPAGIPGRRSGLVSQRLGRAVCMCAHLCVCASVCACVYLCVHVLYTHLCAHMYAFTSVHTCVVHMYICVLVFFTHVHLCVCVGMGGVLCLHVPVCAHEYTCVAWYTHVYPCLCSRVWVCV